MEPRRDQKSQKGAVGEVGKEGGPQPCLRGVLSNTKGLPSHPQKMGCEAPPRRLKAAPPAWGPLEVVITHSQVVVL